MLELFAFTQIEGIESENETAFVFQQDEDPLHLSCEVRHALNARFSNWWIASSEPITWLPGNLGLTPVEFFHCWNM